MKGGIHPQYFDDAHVVCSCGNTFTVGSTKPEIHVELCDNCHPIYTGKQRFVDTASRIDKFETKRKKARASKPHKEIIEKEEEKPQTLREMLQALKR